MAGIAPFPPRAGERPHHVAFPPETDGDVDSPGAVGRLVVCLLDYGLPSESETVALWF